MSKLNYKRLDEPRQAVILSHNRSGGTYLCHSLNSHPLIHCLPDEVIHSKNVFMRNIKDAVTVLKIVLFIQQFEVSMCKISHVQFVEYDDARDYLKTLPDLRVINLSRGNWVASGLSEMIRHKQNHPTHAFYQRPKVGSVVIDPERLWSIMWSQKGESRKVASYLKEFPNIRVLNLTYPEIVGGEGKEADEIPEETGKTICDFLEVPYEPMYCGYMRKASDIYKMVSNWSDVKERLVGTKFEGMMREIEKAYE